jgi:hypothetical protein
MPPFNSDTCVTTWRWDHHDKFLYKPLCSGPAIGLRQGQPVSTVHLRSLAALQVACYMDHEIFRLF